MCHDSVKIIIAYKGSQWRLFILLYPLVLSYGGGYYPETAYTIYLVMRINVEILNTMIKTNMAITIPHVYLSISPASYILYPTAFIYLAKKY